MNGIFNLKRELICTRNIPKIHYLCCTNVCFSFFLLLLFQRFNLIEENSSMLLLTADVDTVGIEFVFMNQNTRQSSYFCFHWNPCGVQMCMIQSYHKGGCMLKSLVSSHFARCSAGMKILWWFLELHVYLLVTYYQYFTPFFYLVYDHSVIFYGKNFNAICQSKQQIDT